MFTGIVKGLCPVVYVDQLPGMLKYSVMLTEDLGQGLTLGASISVNGVCQTIVKIDGCQVWFDAIQETLNRTTLVSIRPNDYVNIEPSARFGDEIGGHLLSGHIYGTGVIKAIHKTQNNMNMKLQVPKEWLKYFFCKGFIALDGVSLTLGEIDTQSALLTLYLIPETLRLTTFGTKKVGDFVNIEFDSQAQAIVETVERILSQKEFFN